MFGGVIETESRKYDEEGHKGLFKCPKLLYHDTVQEGGKEDGERPMPEILCEWKFLLHHARLLVSGSWVNC
jgi:hypothetical protein